MFARFVIKLHHVIGDPFDNDSKINVHVHVYTTTIPHSILYNVILICVLVKLASLAWVLKQ